MQTRQCNKSVNCLVAIDFVIDSRVQAFVLIGLAVVGLVSLVVCISVVLDPIGISSDLDDVEMSVVEFNWLLA